MSVLTCKCEHRMHKSVLQSQISILPFLFIYQVTVESIIGLISLLLFLECDLFFIRNSIISSLQDAQYC